MPASSSLLYLHGLESTSQSGKARLFAVRYPGMLTPDFVGDFDERMTQLEAILGGQRNWTLLGSSFGGLMAAVFALDHATQVRRLVLLAPALVLPPFVERAVSEVCPVPTVVVHGSQDDIIPPAPVLDLCRKVFSQLEYVPVEDDHRLHRSFLELDWDRLLEWNSR